MTAFLCDVHTWFSLAVENHTHNDLVTDWLDSLGPSDVAWLCRATQQGLLRLLTNQHVLGGYNLEPRSNAEAAAIVATLLSDERVSLQSLEPPALEAAWYEDGAISRPAPQLWMDAYLAAFARASNATLVTLDGGFRQFPGLSLRLIERPSPPPGR